MILRLPHNKKWKSNNSRYFTGVSYNDHEAELDSATLPHNEYKKSIRDSVKNELFLITAMRRI